MILVGSMDYKAQRSLGIIGVGILEGGFTPYFTNKTLEGFQLIVVKGQVYDVHGHQWLR